MVRDKFFVITGVVPWTDNVNEKMQSLAREIARSNRVLYVNPPYSLSALVGNNNEAAGSQEHVSEQDIPRLLNKVNDGLWILEMPLVLLSPKQIYSATLFDETARRNNRRSAEIIKWAMAFIDARNPFLICDNAMLNGFYLKEYLIPVMTIYYRQIASPPHEYLKTHARRLIPEMARKCDLVITSDDSLADEVRRYNYNTFNIGKQGDHDDEGRAITWSTCVERFYTALEYVCDDRGTPLEEHSTFLEYVFS